MRPVDIPAIALSVPRPPRVDAPAITPAHDYTGQQIAEAGSGVAAFGGGVASMMRQRQDELDTARTREADNRAADEIRRALYDPETGYTTKIGRAALGDAREQTFAALRTRLEAIDSRLDNDVQRSKFRAAMEDRLVDAETTADAHQTRQQRAYGIGETQAAIEGGITDLVAAIGTPRFDKEMALLVDLADELNDWTQGGPEAKKQVRQDVTTKAHTAVVEDLVRREQGTLAGKYLEAVRQEVNPQDRPKLDALVDRGTLNEQATALALELTADARAETTYPQGSTREQKVQTFLTAEQRRIDALVAARDKLDRMFSDGKVTDRVRAAVRDRFREMEHDARLLAADKRITYIERAQQALRDDPRLTAERLPDNLYVPLVAMHGLDEVVAWQENRRNATDPAVMDQVIAMSAQELRSMSQTELRSKLLGHVSDSGMAYAMAKWASANDPDNAGPRSLVSMRDRLRAFARMPAVGILTNATSEQTRREEEARFDDFVVRFDDRMRQWQLDNKRKATDQDVQDMLDRTAVDTVHQVGMFGGAKSERVLGLIPKTEQDDYYVTVAGKQVPIREVALIPAKVLTVVQRTLRDSGEPVTTQNVLREWYARGKPMSIE